MAKRHNEFGQLLGTVENDPQPLTGGMPMSNVPDLEGVAMAIEDAANFHAESMKNHASVIRSVAQFQPRFNSDGDSL